MDHKISSETSGFDMKNSGDFSTLLVEMDGSGGLNWSIPMIFGGGYRLMHYQS